MSFDRLALVMSEEVCEAAGFSITGFRPTTFRLGRAAAELTRKTKACRRDERYGRTPLSACTSAADVAAEVAAEVAADVVVVCVGAVTVVSKVVDVVNGKRFGGIGFGAKASQQ